MIVVEETRTEGVGDKEKGRQKTRETKAGSVQRTTRQRTGARSGNQKSDRGTCMCCLGQMSSKASNTWSTYTAVRLRRGEEFRTMGTGGQINRLHNGEIPVSC